MKLALPSLLITLSLLTACTTEPPESVANLAQATGIVALTLPQVQAGLDKGEFTSEQLVKAYLARIEAIDKNGPTLRSVLTVNPDALKQAQQADQLRQKGSLKGPLHGIPVLLKDNIESLDNMATTAGALALIDNVTGRDSPLVAGLRAQGAIILGKTNLSQWANFRSENSMSGWSALGGQVKNPHMLDRNPCGSSSGSGAAVAASLASAAVGTETNGSIICPSNANGIVGFKPTVGVISQQYIIPISASQDTAGPMTKTVEGAALMMNGMASDKSVDYTQKLTKDSLKGVRVGVLRFAQGETAHIVELFERALMDLQAAGAELVMIEDGPNPPNNFGRASYDLLKFEFKEGINQYLASTSPSQVKTRNLSDLIEFNLQHQDVELTLFDQSIFNSSFAMDSLESEEYLNAKKLVQNTTRENGIDLLLAEHQVDVLLAPSGLTVPRRDAINGDVWPNDWPGYGSHAAKAGYPHITVPMGTVHGLPVGISFIGTANDDVNVLGYAYAYEQQSQRRAEPEYWENAEQLPNIAKSLAGYLASGANSPK